VALFLFFPVLWMVITSLKGEATAETTPPHFLPFVGGSYGFSPTLSEYRQAFSEGVGHPLAHSLFTTLTSTAVVLVLAVPAAYALSVRPIKRAKDVLFFFLSTKMLPYVAAIVPLYIIVEDIGRFWIPGGPLGLDKDGTLVILYAGLNLPIAVWMIRSFLVEVPKEVLEAARVDGAKLRTEVVSIILPIVVPGIAATALICFIFSWNEFFYASFLTTVSGPTVPVFLVGSIQTEGLFFGQLAAISTLASLPVIAAGWIAQKQLVRGLSLGAVK
jgi:sorbitol/mannitol transport system permease protein